MQNSRACNIFWGFLPVWGLDNNIGKEQIRENKVGKFPKEISTNLVVTYNFSRINLVQGNQHFI